VITGEATYRGKISVDGTVCGQLGAAASTLTIKQRPRTGSNEPELDGELSFKDLLRINGHVAGQILSPKGTLIVDTSARVELINVGICVVSGTVVSDIVGLNESMAPGATVIGARDACSRSKLARSFRAIVACSKSEWRQLIQNDCFLQIHAAASARHSLRSLGKKPFKRFPFLLSHTAATV
jgi:cytoskeletal protein CcmA (bactofilin family)